MKKIMTEILLISMLMMLLVGCGNTQKPEINEPEMNVEETNTEIGEESNAGEEINVITREEGSGTRGAFIELFELEEKLDDGTKKDLISKEASVESNTNTILTTVQNDTYAIGYVSMGSLNDNVKAVKIDGVDATAGNVKNGTYKISRPFNIATKGEPEGVAKDFLDFILSQEGQEVVSASYISIDENAAAYAGAQPSGSITVGGSSSVSPLMEKLIEEYQKVNPNATIELQTSDSSIGMTKTIEGAYDIGMASRELKDSETAELIGAQIALDGIAVIVNTGNAVTELSKENVKQIYLGEVLTWGEI